MENLRTAEWNSSYQRNENHIFYPKEEVVKFVNRFIRRKCEKDSFEVFEGMNNPRGLDYGCGIGRVTKFLHEFGIVADGVDISSVAINKAMELYPEIKDNFFLIQGASLLAEDLHYDFAVCESVIDSMTYAMARKTILELDRVTRKFLFISFIAETKLDSGENIVATTHEKGTVQSYYTWQKIIDLVSESSFDVEWARLITEKSLIDAYAEGRFYVVLKK